MIEQPVWVAGSRQGEPIVSYSQNAEDVRLCRVFGAIEDGFYVDVGAADPSLGSVTRLFYDRGWCGVNVEPSPAFEALSAARQRDINLRVAVGESDGLAQFFLTYPDLGMSTVDPAAHAHVSEKIERVEEITVTQRRLESILREQAAGRTIHFLKVDVEGMERDVLASSDWDVFRPIVVVVEAVAAWSTSPTFEAWEPLLLGAGYEFAAFDGINRFYVDRDHSELIPALGYPMSALDQFVSASAVETEDRVRHLEDDRASIATELDHARAEREGARHELEEARHELQGLRHEFEGATHELEGARHELEGARHELEGARHELEGARHELYTVYHSPTWRAGRIAAAVGRPALQIVRRLWRPRLSRGRKPAAMLPPAQAYATFTKSGQPWHFPRAQSKARMRLGGSSLEILLHRFGEPQDAVDVDRASELGDQLDEIDWSDDESLVAKRLTWDERQAVVEADAIVRLVRGGARGKPTSPQLGVRTFEKPLVVVDARCLQEPAYSSRGVGLHGRRFLEAIRMVAPGHSLVLLTSADRPPLTQNVAELAGSVAVVPYDLRAAHVSLFVQLSPMTASCAPTVPFLGRPGCAAVSIVHDFIPTEFPAAYLRATESALTNRMRIEALRYYDLLLPNSHSTEVKCQSILGESAATVVTGVGDPLHGVRSRSSVVDGSYMLVCGGGDARKNIPAAVAALARHRQAGGGPLRAVVTGALTGAQALALNDLSSRVGLPENALELRGYVAADELAGLYETAELTFVASVAEGFSIPVAESVARGTPAVASDIPVHRELLGSGPWLAPSTDVEALAVALGHVRSNREAVAEQQRTVLGDQSDPARVVDQIAAALEPRPGTRTSTARSAAHSRLAPTSRGRLSIPAAAVWCGRLHRLHVPSGREVRRGRRVLASYGRGVASAPDASTLVRAVSRLPLRRTSSTWSATVTSTFRFSISSIHTGARHRTRQPNGRGIPLRPR